MYYFDEEDQKAEDNIIERMSMQPLDNFFDYYNDVHKINKKSSQQKLKELNKIINGHIDGFQSTNHYGCNDAILEVLEELKEIIDK